MSTLGDRSWNVARHRRSHSKLLVPIPGGRPPASVDAVVVPTRRPAALLDEAIAVARGLDCPIVVLCSRDSKASTAGELLTDVAGIAATVSSTPRSPLLDLHTHRFASPLAEPYLDTGNKRNVALLLGRLLGWQRVLFMDDDIRGLSADEVRVAAAGVAPDELRLVGWPYPDFPDNSVVCHALRSSGYPQEVFPGAGALLVGLTGRLPFFPPVYNEDWLFFHDFVRQGRAGVAGPVQQLRFDPFDAERARREEFGDVLAEGLFNLIHARRPVSVALFPGYWDVVLAQRRILLDGIVGRLEHLACHHRDARRYEHELLAVEAAQDQLAVISATSLADFVGAWRYDLYRWNARLHALPRLHHLTDALSWLGITDMHRG